MRGSRRPVVLVGALFAAVIVGAVALALDAGREAAPEVLVERARFPTSMVPLPDGGMLYSERTGAVRRVDRDGRLLVDPVAVVPTEAGDDQRGLLGLARDTRGRLFGAWTRSGDGRLVVGQVAPDRRTVWEGPRSEDRANGGHLAIDARGRLIIGVGDLLDRAQVVDPNAPNGKLLRLDPDGPPQQRPELISAGWNNPFAFALTASGALWVADNAPGGEPERLARADRGGRPSSVTELSGATAPSGLVALREDRFALCGFLSGELRLYDIDEDGSAVEDTGARIDGCRLGVARLSDGRMALAEEDRIRVVDL